MRERRPKIGATGNETQSASDAAVNDPIHDAACTDEQAVERKPMCMDVYVYICVCVCVCCLTLDLHHAQYRHHLSTCGSLRVCPGPRPCQVITVTHRQTRLSSHIHTHTYIHTYMHTSQRDTYSPMFGVGVYREALTSCIVLPRNRGGVGEGEPDKTYGGVRGGRGGNVFYLVGRGKRCRRLPARCSWGRDSVFFSLDDQCTLSTKTATGAFSNWL
ncbi:hypothetical protein F4778DRAFT_451425 [Xylariomycetidae sp. FL2044]|nr:hypothetical protein F4778DRAFT_451425 [Xylariomycetidae sp. FL2044]